MTPQQFIAKWREAQLSERSAYQQHFCDLCDLLGEPKPADADRDGAWYTFERGVTKTDGENGWADVWMRGHFGWEYKGKRKNLKEAYKQLLQYREDLENPPLLVVCDLDRFEIHTNFANTSKVVHAFSLADLDQPQHLETLRRLFTNPDALKPGLTAQSITEQAAERFGILADGLRTRGIEPQRAAHFLMKLMFSMFAEDVELLPEKLFKRVVKNNRNDPAKLHTSLGRLFEAMAGGGDFGADPVLRFNGGLFNDAESIQLTPDEIKILLDVVEYDWGAVEPSIFGTLFERTLDPAKRSQIGAHYTSKADILTLLEPVVMQPLRREWDAVRGQCDELWPKIQQKARAGGRTKTAPRRDSPERKKFEALLRQFSERLAHVTILDPACGSGNFLYVAINLLLDLNKEVIRYAANHGVSLLPSVRPTQLYGLEINEYARELAQVVIWIGYLQWMHDNGMPPQLDPVLEPIETIRHTDAILDLTDSAHPKEPEWPAAEFIVGNPPFLGTKKLRSELGDQYVESLFNMYGSRIPSFSDLCCYWFEKARAQIQNHATKRAGLLATQGIRGGLNREVLNRIKATGGIFFAIGDRDWILDGAHVHVSLIGFDDGSEKTAQLDDRPVATINSNLSALADITKARQLPSNRSIGFIADVKAGAFDIAGTEAKELLTAPNPNRLPNSDVLRPWTNGLDVVRRPRNMWIIDFGADMSLADAAKYELPFDIVRRLVKPMRDKVKRKSYREYWWLHAEPCDVMRQRLAPLHRFLATPTVAKHRLFVWMPPETLPDHQLVAFARDDDYYFGVLHSRIHEIWARAPGMGTQVRERESGFRYTPTSCFETFPFPEPTDEQRDAIAAAARELDQLRNNWLNPPEWTRQEILEFPGSVDGPWERYVHNADSRGIGTVRYPRLVPKDAECAKQLTKRTLTNLYNARPTWLALAHARLDAAVSTAYGWPADLTDDKILSRLLAMNLERTGTAQHR